MAAVDAEDAQEQDHLHPPHVYSVCPSMFTSHLSPPYPTQHCLSASREDENEGVTSNLGMNRHHHTTQFLDLANVILDCVGSPYLTKVFLYCVVLPYITKVILDCLVSPCITRGGICSQED